MSITPAEMGFYKPKTINNKAANGGRMSHLPFTDASSGNVFPPVYLDSLGVDITDYRKVFMKLLTDDDAIATSAKIAMLRPMSADDELTFFMGTQEDVQADLTGSEQQFGCGQLQSDITAGATSLVVTTEAGSARPIFDNSMLIMISNKTSVSSGTGQREYLQLASSGAVSWNGNDATLTLDAGSTPQNDYLAAETYVSSVIDVAGGIAGSASGYSVTSSAGTFDDTNHPVAVHADAGIFENWTLTFSSSTNYDLVGDTVGALVGGSIASDFSPNNPFFNKPYLTIPAAAFGGTFASGDQITFTTDPFSVPIWTKRFTPAGAVAGSSDGIIFFDVS